jgi:hypothetical protein
MIFDGRMKRKIAGNSRSKRKKFSKNYRKYCGGYPVGQTPRDSIA